MKKERTEQGCHDTGTSFRGRTQSEFIYDITDNEEDNFDDDDECDDDGELPASVPNGGWENTSMLSEGARCRA